MKLRAFLCVLLLTWALATFGTAQVITSTILGEVTDPTGAAVPGAEVVITNIDTGIAVRGATNASGAFSFPNLLAGNYEIGVSREGFQTAMAKEIVLLSSTTLRRNVQLKIGQTSEAITITGEAPLLQTASPTISGTLTERQISDLPLGVQSITGLLNLGPGAQTAWGANAPQTGGATHWGGTNFTINGLTVNDFGNGNGGAALGLALVNLPSVNSLQEFKTDSVNMSAEYRAVGSVSMVTKQGGNRFHGSAFEYNQNTILSANTFQLNRSGQERTRLNRNQFGGNLGGPIIQNKAFFFFDYSGMRQRTVSAPLLNVPNADMRNGDFSALCSQFANGVCAAGKGVQLYNPFTGDAFPQNRIPASMITPQAKALLAYYPLPNYLPPVSGYVSGLPNNQGNFLDIIPVAKNLNTYTFRGDYRISDSDSIYGVVNRIVGEPWFEPQGTPRNYGNYGNAGHRVAGVSVSHVHIFSGSLINDARVGWFDSASARKGQNPDIDPRSFFPQLTPSSNRGLPGIGLGGYLKIGDANNGGFSPQYTIQFTDNLTYVRGRHTFKFGIDETGYKSYVRQGFAPLGSFTFNGGWTSGKGWPGVTASQGNSFADFLLGVPSATATGLVPPDQVGYSRDWEFYGQDTWQVSTRLTFYYGMRYTYQSPWRLRGRLVTFYDPATNQLALPQDSDKPTLPAYASPALFAAYPFTTTKALGLPLDYIAGDKNNYAPRLGLAYRFLNSTVIRAGYGIYFNFHPLFIGSRTDNNNPPWGGTSLSYSTKLPGKPATPFLPDLTFADPFPSSHQASGVAANPTIYSFQQNFEMAAAQQWNVTLEHQITPSWLGRASYVGSKTDHLPLYLSDLNLPEKQTPNVPLQQQRPLKPWAAVNSTRSAGMQKMHQLQLEAIRRMASGFSLQAEYSWTRSLDNVELTGQTNWHFPWMDYGNSSYIRRHQLVVNYIYELPFGRGKKWLAHAGGIVDSVFGGWQASGITTYATGTPFSVAFQVPTTYTGWLGGRADVVPGVPVYVKGKGHDITTGVPYLNRDAFAPPQPWTYGNSQRNAYWTPGRYNWDVSLMKAFQMPFHETARLQLRGDFLNITNHMNLGGPGATIPSTQYGGQPIPTAGLITGGSGSRVIQVGLRLQF